MLRSSFLPPGCPSPWLTADSQTERQKQRKIRHTSGFSTFDTRDWIQWERHCVSTFHTDTQSINAQRKERSSAFIIILMAVELNSDEPCQSTIRSPLISQSKTCLKTAVRQCNPLIPTQNPINCPASLSPSSSSSPHWVYPNSKPLSLSSNLGLPCLIVFNQ